MVSQRVLCRRFIGRAAEIEHLAERRRAAGDSRGSAVVVFGEPGIGKSRLMREYRERFGARCTLAVADCREFGEGPLDPLARVLAQLGARAADVLETARASKHEQRSAILTAFENATARRLTTVIIEDAHWAQNELLAILALLAQWAANRRFLLIVTSRNVDPAVPAFKALAHLARHASILRLEPFERFELDDLMNGALADFGASIPAEAFDDVRRRASGNPLFAEELLRHAVDATRRPRARRARIETLPISLQGVIRERLDRCEAGDRAILSAASIFGRRFRVDLLGDVFALERAAIVAALVRLIELQLVDRCDDPLAYEFRHALTRDVVYGDLVPAEAHALHLRVAEAIEALPGANAHAELLAHSFWEARLPERAAPYCEAAGDAAANHYAYEDAALWFERAVNAYAGRPGDSGRVLKKAAIAMDRLAESKRAAALYDRAIEAFLADGDFASALEHTINLSGVYFNDGREDEAFAAADRGLEIAERSASSALRHMALLRRFSLFTVAGRRRDAARTLAAIDETLLDPAARATFEYHISKSSYYAHEYDAARRRESIASALESIERRAAPDYERRYAHGFAAVDSLHLGETGAAREHACAALEIARRIRSDEAYMLSFLAVIEERAGRLDEARAYLAQVAPATIVLTRHVRAIVRIRLALAAGDVDALRDALDLPLLREAQQGARKDMTVTHLCAHAAVYARLGEPGESRRLAEDAFEALAAIGEPYGLSWEIAALARLLPHRIEALRRLVAPTEATPRGAVEAALAAELAGLAARRDGQSAAGRDHALDGAARFAAIGWPAPQAACLELADELAAALALYRQHGYLADVRRIERSASAEGRETGALSPREREVARLIALGKNNREAALELSITVKAVEKYLTSIYQKLGIKSRSQLATYVMAATAPRTAANQAKSPQPR
jgi:DNA-binding CsgD family transcriptional regulator